MVYGTEDEDRPLKKPRDFNLCTANTKLPKYDPMHDKNLAYFFDKPANKKLA